MFVIKKRVAAMGEGPNVRAVNAGGLPVTLIPYLQDPNVTDLDNLCEAVKATFEAGYFTKNTVRNREAQKRIDLNMNAVPKFGMKKDDCNSAVYDSEQRECECIDETLYTEPGRCNEDHAFCVNLDHDRFAICVLDGVGGSPATNAEIALFTETLSFYLEEELIKKQVKEGFSFKVLDEVIFSACEKTRAQISDGVSGRPCTTLSMVIIDPGKNEYLCKKIGDSTIKFVIGGETEHLALELPHTVTEQGFNEPVPYSISLFPDPDKDLVRDGLKAYLPYVPGEQPPNMSVKVTGECSFIQVITDGLQDNTAVDCNGKYILPSPVQTDGEVRKKLIDFNDDELTIMAVAFSLTSETMLTEQEFKELKEDCERLKQQAERQILRNQFNQLAQNHKDTVSTAPVENQEDLIKTLFRQQQQQLRLQQLLTQLQSRR